MIRHLPTADSLWQEVLREADRDGRADPLLADLLERAIVRHGSIQAAIAARMAASLGTADLREERIGALFQEVMIAHDEVVQAAVADLFAVQRRDRASNALYAPLLHSPGFLGLQAHRVAHVLFENGRQGLATYLQSRIAATFGMDIHPGARLGRGLVIDHALGVVIGETAVVGDSCYLFHGVTLGSTGKTGGERHPKIGTAVVLGAGATILGDVRVGDAAVVGAGSVVLSDVPPGILVAGVPARVIGPAKPVQQENGRESMVGEEEALVITRMVKREGLDA